MMSSSDKTPNISPEDRERFLAVGMNDTLVKPFEREAFLDLAAKLCGR